MGTDGPQPGPLPFFAAALWSAVFAALGQGGHLALDHGLTAFAAVAYTGFFAPLLVAGAVAVAVVLRAARALGWLSSIAAQNRTALIAWSWSDPVEVLGRRSAAIVSATVSIAVFAGASWLLGRAILSAVARPTMGLALLVGAQLVLAVVALAVFIVAYRAACWLTAHFQRRALVAPATVVGGVAIAGAIAAVVVRTSTDVGAHLPWDFATATLAGIGGWLIARRSARSLPAAAVALALLTVCAAVTIKMPESRRADRAVFTAHSPIATVLYRPLHDALDRDGDGSIHLYGGGDCAPDDPDIHPHALEKLNNGIDEDCSGADFTDDVSFDEAARSHGKPPHIKEKPHVVLITTDSLSFESTSLGREDRDTTPNLARWANDRAAVYEAAFALGPSTRLAFPGIMASVHNSSVKMRRIKSHPYAWDASTPTITSKLKKAGYRTVMVTPHKYFSTRWKQGVSNGFDVQDHSATKNPADPIHTAPEVTAAAIGHLEAAAEADRPMFLWVHYYDHHSPFRRPKDGIDFGSKKVDLFDSEVEYADRHWGMLFDAIDRLLGDDVVVIFTSDHGESFDRFHQKKHHGFDLRTPVMWVPLMIAAPQTTHRRVTGLASHADIPPTIADLTGLLRDEAWIGESLVPTLYSAAQPEKSVVYGLFYLPERHKKGDAFTKISVRTQDWYYERELRDHGERLTHWPEDVSGEKDLAEKERETTDILRQLALQKLDQLQRSERGLTGSE